MSELPRCPDCGNRVPVYRDLGVVRVAPHEGCNGAGKQVVWVTNR